MREFETGATRNLEEDKLDFESFLSHDVLVAFAEYMERQRPQDDGSMRASDNWQLGIPQDVYMKSAFRHFFAWWNCHRNGQPAVEECCALLFNLQGYMFEELKKKPKAPTSTVDDPADVREELAAYIKEIGKKYPAARFFLADLAKNHCPDEFAMPRPMNFGAVDGHPGPDVRDGRKAFDIEVPTDDEVHVSWEQLRELGVGGLMTKHNAEKAERAAIAWQDLPSSGLRMKITGDDGTVRTFIEEEENGLTDPLSIAISRLVKADVKLHQIHHLMEVARGEADVADPPTTRQFLDNIIEETERNFDSNNKETTSKSQQSESIAYPHPRGR